MVFEAEKEQFKVQSDKPVLSKTNKVIILILAVIFFIFSIFNVYLEIRRQFMCSQMALFNTQVPPFDIDSYILRKEAFENICLERTGLGSYFWAFTSFWFLGYAVTLFGKHTEKVQVADKKQKISFVSRQQKEKEIGKDAIYGLLETNHPLTNNDVEAMIGISDATATRYFDELEKEGKVRQVGKTGKHVYYEKV